MSNDWALPVCANSSRTGRTKMTGMIARRMKTSVGVSLSLGRFPFAGRQSNTPTQRVLPPIGVILWTVDRCGLAIRKADVHPSVHSFVSQFLSRIPEPKGVRATTSLRARPAPLVFPVGLVHEQNVHAPNDNGLPRFDGFGWVNQIAPNNVPAGVVVV